MPEVVAHPELAKAKASVEKACNFQRRERLFILRQKGVSFPICSAVALLAARKTVEDMLQWTSQGECNKTFRLHALLYALAYTFLLRVPSEALPMVVGKSGQPCSEKSVLYLENDDTLVLELSSRKNKPQGSKLIRKCCCVKHPASCAVHLMKPLLDNAVLGTPIFRGITAADSVKTLRQLLFAVQIKDAGLYRPHDLRRGHAEDLRLQGAPLWKILAAGEWRSAAFQAYLGLHKLDVDEAMSGVLDEESDDDFEP